MISPVQFLCFSLARLSLSLSRACILKGPLLLQVRLMHEFGYVLGNLDATIILQRPKLSPHKEKIRANLCELLGADPSVVNIKVGLCLNVVLPSSVRKFAWILSARCR